MYLLIGLTKLYIYGENIRDMSHHMHLYIVLIPLMEMVSLYILLYLHV
jgi:hypothetical protein